MPTQKTIATGATDLRSVLGQLFRRLRAEQAIPITQGSVLGRLDRVGPLTASVLAAGERVRPQSMAQTVAELETEGLVARRPDPSDRRQTLIELTPAGHAKVRELRSRGEGWLASAIAAELNADEQQELLRAIPLLQRLVNRS